MNVAIGACGRPPITDKNKVHADQASALFEHKRLLSGAGR